MFVETDGNNIIGNGKKEGNVLFNEALNTFYLRLYGVGIGNGYLY